MVWLAYGLLALVAAWLSSDCGRPIGFALVAGWVVANALFFFAPAWRFAVSPVSDLAILAVSLWSFRQSHSAWPLVISVFGLAAIASNLSFLLVTRSASSEYLYNYVGNVIFALQCISLGSWGIADDLARIADLRRVLRDRDDVAGAYRAHLARWDRRK